MKTWLGYLSILLVVLAISRPAIPFIEVAINHTYIVKELCIGKYGKNCQGQCHLEKSVSDSHKQESNNKATAIEFDLELCPLHLPSSAINTNTLMEQKLKHLCQPEMFCLQEYSNILLAPPQV